MAVLSLLGCQGSDEEATSVEQDTTPVVIATGTTGPPEETISMPEGRLLRWIKSCEVRRMVFTHERGVYSDSQTEEPFGYGSTRAL